MGNPTRILGGSGHPAFYWALNEMAETHDRKNQDYANPTDPFANFRACEKAGISMVDGIYTRMSDKWERITNLIAKQRRDVQPAVVGESLGDTLIDLANYAIILRIALNEAAAPTAGPKGTTGFAQLRDVLLEECESQGVKLAMNDFQRAYQANRGVTHNETYRG